MGDHCQDARHEPPGTRRRPVVWLWLAGCIALLIGVVELGAFLADPGSASAAATPEQAIAEEACPTGSAGGGVAGAAPAGDGTGLDYFSNFGSYTPRVHCMSTAEGDPDWAWIIASLLLSSGVVFAYLRIFTFWRNAYRAERPEDRIGQLMDLAHIFLWCAVCGYVMSMLMFAWPAYRLLAVCLLVLNFFSWRFVRNIDAFAVSFTAKRHQRELNEHLRARSQELEREVAARTAEAERAREFAERSASARAEFLANMSHEIRTPMTAILGYAEMLQQDEGAHAARERVEAYETIARNGEHLLRIVNDILDIAKIEDGRMELERVPVGTRPLLEDVCSLLRGRAEARGITLSMEVDDSLPATVLADPTRLRQILINLIGNAIKFTERGGVTIHADADAPSGEDGLTTVRFAVRDSGVGMSEEQVRRLFDRFAQAEDSTTRRFGGSGLGLSISRGLAQLMGGGIEVESTEGGGSTFTLSLRVPIAAAGREASGHGSRASSSERLDARVLLAEDGEDNRRLISFMLKKAGCEVVAAENGRIAVDAALAAGEQGRPFDLILMDMSMPVMDGIAALEELRGLGYRGRIVALTANVMQRDRDRALAAGADGFLSKPIGYESLVRGCREALHRRAAA